MFSTHLKNISQNGNLPQIGLKILFFLKPPPGKPQLFGHFVLDSLTTHHQFEGRPTGQDHKFLPWNLLGEHPMLAGVSTWGERVLYHFMLFFSKISKKKQGLDPWFLVIFFWLEKVYISLISSSFWSDWSVCFPILKRCSGKNICAQNHRIIASLFCCYVSLELPAGVYSHHAQIPTTKGILQWLLGTITMYENRTNKKIGFYHLESRWSNSHESWFIMAPYKSPPFESCAIYIHHGANDC